MTVYLNQQDCPGRPRAGRDTSTIEVQATDNVASVRRAVLRNLPEGARLLDDVYRLHDGWHARGRQG